MIPNMTIATKKIVNQRKKSFYLVQKNGTEKVQDSGMNSIDHIRKFLNLLL